MIILAAYGTGGPILFPTIAIKGKPIIHTAIPITTILGVPGIRIHTAIPIGIHTIITAMTCGIGKPGRMGRFNGSSLFSFFFFDAKSMKTIRLGSTVCRVNNQTLAAIANLNKFSLNVCKYFWKIAAKSRNELSVMILIYH